MESIKGYDHWKTIPPEPEEEKQEYCTCCGRPVYSGDSLYTFDGQTLCEECVKEMQKPEKYRQYTSISLIE